MATSPLEEMLIRHEGLRLKLYTCPAGKQTIGVGRNLEDLGITKDEALLMLQHDVDRCWGELRRAYPWTQDLNPARIDVLLDMLFNLGLTRLAGFKKFLDAMAKGDFLLASREMLMSKWADQVGDRARELSYMIETGRYRGE